MTFVESWRGADEQGERIRNSNVIDYRTQQLHRHMVKAIDHSTVGLAVDLPTGKEKDGSGRIDQLFRRNLISTMAREDYHPVIEVEPGICWQ